MYKRSFPARAALFQERPRELKSLTSPLRFFLLLNLDGLKEQHSH